MSVGVEPYVQLGARTANFASGNKGYLITPFPAFSGLVSVSGVGGFTVSLWFKYSATSERNGNFFAVGGLRATGYYFAIGREASTETVRYVTWDGTFKSVLPFAAYDVWHSTSFSIGTNFCWQITLDSVNICNCCAQSRADLFFTTGADASRNHANVLIGSLDMPSESFMNGHVDDVRVYDRVVSYAAAMAPIETRCIFADCLPNSKRSGAQPCVCYAGYAATATSTVSNLTCVACSA